MKTKLSLLIFGALALTLWPTAGRAQDNTATNQSATVTVAEPTNAEPTLKELMAANNSVKNTAGIVLVKISPTLWAGKYEVTQDAYSKVMYANPSAFNGRQNPVDSVSWNDAMAFCQKLTAKERAADELPDGYSYSLPTESQWETLAANASLDDAVMKLKSARSSTAPVGSLGANSLGLYDTRGNVMEWCLDAHDPSYHVLRGGGWDTFAEASARLEFRWYAHLTDGVRNDFGFRVVLEPAGAQ
jgi:formylglycine-generating enzyme required for sulfatase activity